MRKICTDYLFNILVAVDQLINALFLGDPDETLSSRMGKNLETCRICRILCNLLNIIDPDHCQKFVEWDEGKRDLLNVRRSEPYDL